LYNRVAFVGSLSAYFTSNLPDLTRREFTILITLVSLTVIFGIFSSPIFLDGLHYPVSTLIYAFYSTGYLSMALITGISRKRFYYYNKPL
jgi:NADH-ubiquinone oxidoreductase chain 4